MPKSKTKKLKDKLWKLVSEYIRRSHADSNGYVACYTCGHTRLWNDTMQAGHAIGGRRNSVLFDLELLRPQCRACNCWRQGEQYIFAKKLDEEHYPGWFEERLDESRKTKKYYDSDYEDMIESIQGMLEEL